MQVEGMWPYWLDGHATNTVKNSFDMSSMYLLTGDPQNLTIHTHTHTYIYIYIYYIYSSQIEISKPMVLNVELLSQPELDDVICRHC